MKQTGLSQKDARILEYGETLVSAYGIDGLKELADEATEALKRKANGEGDE